MESLKDLALMVSKKKARLMQFSNEEICELSPLKVKYVQPSRKVIYL